MMVTQKQAEKLEVTRFESAGGAHIFQIPVKEFPILWGYVYFVVLDDEEYGQMRVLIDTGSGFGDCNEHLVNGLKSISQTIDQPISLNNLTHILITHGHIDHFGGLNYIRPQTSARIGVHELDMRNLTNYEQRLVIISKRLNEWFIEAGVSDRRRDRLIEMYEVTKSLYHSVSIDFTYEAVGMRVGPFEMLHVPGHSAGHVVIRLHDVLFSGDHVLNRTSPHQSPERLTLSTGLEHYLSSLDRLRPWTDSIRLTLGGHESPIDNLSEKIDSIHQIHRNRLRMVFDYLALSHTISEISKDLFGDVHGYNVLLALEEAGAHVEYLYQRGLLEIENIVELEKSSQPIPIRYQKNQDMSKGMEFI